jgi:predicted Zn-dependent protease
VPTSWDDGFASMAPTDRAAVAARGIARADAAKVQMAGFFERSAREHAMQNSEGLKVSSRSTEGGYTVTSRTTDGTGSGWAGGTGWRRSELDDAALSARSIEKATASANPKPLPPGKYTVILEPQAVYEMLAYMVVLRWEGRAKALCRFRHVAQRSRRSADAKRGLRR